MRKSLYFIHKWLALSFVLPFIFLALTGLTMTLWPQSTPFKTDATQSMALDTILRNLQIQRPGASITRVNFNQETLTAYLKSDGMRLVTIERGEGKIINEENPVLNPLLFSKTLHESFFLNGPGKVMVAICGLGLVLVILSGLFFWARKNIFQQVMNLFVKGKISRFRDLHLMVAVLVFIPLLYASATGFFIELNSLFWQNKKLDPHTPPLGCSFEQQLNIIKRFKDPSGRINFCRKDYPYLTYINKVESREITPDGETVLLVAKSDWTENFYYRKHYFVDLHGGDDFGLFKTPYRLWIGLGFLLLSITGLLIWWKKRKLGPPRSKRSDISNSVTPTKA